MHARTEHELVILTFDLAEDFAVTDKERVDFAGVDGEQLADSVAHTFALLFALALVNLLVQDVVGALTFEMIPELNIALGLGKYEAHRLRALHQIEKADANAVFRQNELLLQLQLLKPVLVQVQEQRFWVLGLCTTQLRVFRGSFALVLAFKRDFMVKVNFLDQLLNPEQLVVE